MTNEEWTEREWTFSGGYARVSLHKNGYWGLFIQDEPGNTLHISRSDDTDEDAEMLEALANGGSVRHYDDDWRYQLLVRDNIDAIAEADYCDNRLSVSIFKVPQNVRQGTVDYIRTHIEQHQPSQ